MIIWEKIKEYAIVVMLVALGLGYVLLRRKDKQLQAEKGKSELLEIEKNLETVKTEQRIDNENFANSLSRYNDIIAKYPNLFEKLGIKPKPPSNP